MKKLIIRGMDVRYFTKKVVEWYNQNKRNLPWRTTKDPYKIWLSEVILQQTRVQQGLPYYKNFLKIFPDISVLAGAPVQTVLHAWQGLGYYTRARNLHACAKEILSQYNGEFPESYEELQTLPGVGEYTAAAIASLAFGEPVAVVDGNVFRVLARVFGIDTPVNTSDGKKQINALANQLVARAKPDVYNQAIMEFGALQCTPKNPRCNTCVFQNGCEANRLNLQLSLPVKINRKKNRMRYFYYFVLQHNGEVAMRHRNGKDIWNGLYDFYLIEKNRQTKPEALIHSDSFLNEAVKVCLSISHSRTYKHILSHQTIVSRFTVFQLRKKPVVSKVMLRFYSWQKISSLPKPVLISRFLNDL